MSNIGFNSVQEGEISEDEALQDHIKVEKDHRWKQDKSEDLCNRALEQIFYFYKNAAHFQVGSEVTTADFVAPHTGEDSVKKRGNAKGVTS